MVSGQERRDAPIAHRGSLPGVVIAVARQLVGLVALGVVGVGGVGHVGGDERRARQRPRQPLRLSALEAGHHASERILEHVRTALAAFEAVVSSEAGG